jgi:hypothetical protein
MTGRQRSPLPTSSAATNSGTDQLKLCSGESLRRFGSRLLGKQLSFQIRDLRDVQLRELSGGRDGSERTWQDDLMSDCHYGGVSHALDDPHGLLFCAESDLDYALLRSPRLYRRFADRLHHLLTVHLTAGTSTNRLLLSPPAISPVTCLG